MAVNKVPLTSELILKVEVGTNAAGKPAYKQRVFAGLKAAALDDDVLAVGQGIGSLQQYPSFTVLRLDENTLTA